MPRFLGGCYQRDLTAFGRTLHFPFAIYEDIEPIVVSSAAELVQCRSGDAMEHATKSPSDQPRGRSAAERTAAPGAASAFVDNRPDAVAQRELADAIITSRRVVAQQAFLSTIHNSRRAAVQRQQLASMFGRPAPIPSRVAGAAVVQRLMSVAAFQALTPESFWRPRKAILAIDQALGAFYAAAGHAQVGPIDTLIGVIDTYIQNKVLAGDGANDRIPHATTLRVEATQERPRAIIRDKIFRLRNAPHGAIWSAPVDFVGPLDIATPDQLDAILAVGHIANVADLAALLTAATSTVGAGSAAERLVRVLRENGPPHTPAALAAPLGAKLDIEHKMLRGRGGPPLGANVAPVAGHRDIIGGHSRLILSMASTFAVSAHAAQANATETATFRKVARGDAAGTAADVVNNVAGSVILRFQNRANVGIAFINAPPALNPNFVANAAAAVQLASNNQRANAIVAGNAAIGQFNGHVAATLAAANQLVAGGDPNNATLIAPFVDGVENARASALAILTAAQTLLATPGIVATNPQRASVTQARQGVPVDFTAFETAGPVLTLHKTSTLGPANMSEEEMLRLSVVVAAAPATLFRHHPSGNNPVTGDLISTKHQQVHNGIVWIAMKDNVTYTNNAGVITLNGGTLSAFYPTQHAMVPADPVAPNVDVDGYTAVH